MRRHNMWTCFLSLIALAALTLLPACSNSSNETCDTKANRVEGQEDACENEEDLEEIDAAA